MVNKYQDIIKYDISTKRPYDFLDFKDIKNYDGWDNENNIDEIVTVNRFRDTEFLMSDGNIEYPSSKVTFNLVAALTNKYKGYIVEVCAGPTGGFGSAYLLSDINAKVIISDISPTLMEKWFRMLQKTPYKNATAMSFSICDMPFKDRSIDVISSRYGLVNIQRNSGNYKDALMECHRVLKYCGCLVINELQLTEECISRLNDDQKLILKEKYSNIFVNLHDDLNDLGFKIDYEKYVDVWNNGNDESDLATLCRKWNISLDFHNYILFCRKGK